MTSGLQLSPPPEARDIVRLKIRLEPTGNSQLFSSFPAYALADTPDSLRIAPRTRRLYRVGGSLRELHEETGLRVTALEQELARRPG